MQDAVVTGFILDQLRPNSERIQAAHIRGGVQALSVLNESGKVLVNAGLITIDQQTKALSPVSGHEDEPLEDGLDKKDPLTVAEFCELVNKMGALVAAIDADDGLKALVVKASVRHPNELGAY